MMSDIKEEEEEMNSIPSIQKKFRGRNDLKFRFEETLRSKSNEVENNEE